MTSGTKLLIPVIGFALSSWLAWQMQARYVEGKACEAALQAVRENNLSALQAQLLVHNTEEVKENALAAAIQEERPSMIRFLLGQGAELSGEDAAGCSFLDLALLTDNAEIFEMLYRAGAPPARYRSLLGAAAGAGKPHVVHALLKLRSDPNVKGKDGATPLMHAAGSITAPYDVATAIAEELIVNGADVRAVDPAGDTALILAVYSGNTELVKLLLARGAGESRADNPTGRKSNM